jgi:hypothetical protein
MAVVKKTISKAYTVKDGNMRPEYDFKGAMRRRHYRPMSQGYTVEIKKSDGTTVVEHYTLAEGTVLLQPDVREYLPDSESVNAALQSLIALMAELPAKRKRAAKKRGA